MDSGLGNLSEEWLKVRQVAMGAFVNHFNQGLLATPEQTSERIKAYLTKFDDQLSRDLGISGSKALEIVWWIAETLQEDLDHFRENPTSAFRLGKVMYSELVDRYGSEGNRFWELFTIGRGEGATVNYPTDRT